MEFKVLKNDRAGWQAVWDKLHSRRPWVEEESCFFTAELNTEDDVTNLRYYFPLRSFLRRKGIISRLNLLGSEDMLQRARQFLGALIYYDSALVYFGDEANTQRGRICEAYLKREELESAGANTLSEEEKVLVSCILSSMRMWQDEQGGYTCSFAYPKGRSLRGKGGYLINHNLLRKAIYGVPATAPTSGDHISFFTQSAYSADTSDLLPLIAFNQTSFRSNAGLTDLIELYRSYLEAELQKKGLTLPEADIPSLDGDSLAKLIFYFLLRNLYESGRMLRLNGGREEIDLALLKKTALDSKSYAEGLWQIIENALQHSNGKTGYFGMRIYKADTQAPMSKLAKEANTRSILWRQYWITGTTAHNGGVCVNTSDRSNIFNLTTPDGARVYSDFLEFYVLDDAIDENGDTEGILEKIRSDQPAFNKSKKLHNISDIFQLNEEDYLNDPISFYIKHYGMRWLRMHADRLNAIVQVYSPHQAKRFEYQGQTYVRSGELGGFCYSNIFSDGLLLFQRQKLSSGAVAWADDKTYGRLQSAGNNSFIMEGQPRERTFSAEALELLVPYPPSYSTEYSILVPLAYGPVRRRQKEDQVKPLSFSTDHNFYRDVEVRELPLDFSAFQPGRPWSSQETDIAVRKLAGQLAAQVPGGTAGPPVLHYITLSSHTPFYIELLAKAFFFHIYTAAKSGLSSEDAPAQLFAVDFGDQKALISEFVRIFSIFYTKQGKNTYMSNVQIALCSNARSQSRKEVNFILAGQTLRSAYNTANSFVYHNADSSLEYVPLLEFLTPPDTDTSNRVVSLCPFDLLLSRRDGRCWFLEQIKDKLDTDQRTNRYGCKLSDIHVRLGSKIHINNFYEAELLFHNVGNINRFAYLIARHIDQSLPRDARYVFLVGYENYSAVLLQAVVSLLQDARKQTDIYIYWVIDTHSAGKYPSISFDMFSQEERHAWAGQEIWCYTIIPIGSTMSTVHKLLDSFSRGLDAAMADIGCKKTQQPRRSFGGHYVIVAVGRCFTPGAVMESGGTERNYISTIAQPPELGWYTCQLKPHLNEQSPLGDQKLPLRVHYCLWAETEWHLATPLGASRPQSSCDLRRPLIQVDKTSTLLNAIFPTPLPPEALRYYNHPNPSSKARGGGKTASPQILSPSGPMHFIRYGHIAEGDNHYQFYFDFKKMANSPEIRQQLVDWAKGISIDADAYNIVISPLLITNAVFLKTVIDQVFGSNLHLLHIDINGTGKETVRTKFEYISEELKQISSAYSAIHFYYVDDSICTGATIQRAYKFLLMLCEQAGLEPSKLLRGQDSFHFEKVLLFVNRNSYETARTWVRSPADDWLGFINLCIPSYNTHANTCPACRVRERFLLLSKRSATNQLTEYFSRSASKHQIRTPAEYDRYLSSEILDNPAYLSWLRTYVIGHNKVPESVVKKDDYDAIKKALLDRSVSDKKTLRQLPKSDESPRYDTLMRYVVAQEQFSRLDTMNRAYETLVYGAGLQEAYRRCVEGDGIDPKNLNFAPYQTELMKTLLSLLTGALNQRTNAYDRIMTFSSYIKVISRDYIVRNYFIREAIYTVLHCILILLIEPLEQDTSEEQFRQYFQAPSEADLPENTFWDVISEENYCSMFYDIWKNLNGLGSAHGLNVDLIYRVLKITVHRLALLHSHFMIRGDVVNKVLAAYSALLDRCPSSCQWHLPSIDELVKTYLASIKTATMSEDDDSMCHNLLELGSEPHG